MEEKTSANRKWKIYLVVLAIIIVALTGWLVY